MEVKDVFWGILKFIVKIFLWIIYGAMRLIGIVLQHCSELIKSIIS